MTTHIIGNPEGISDVYTAGKVMKVLDDVSFIDVNIGPGNSGGPVFNENGIVVGITTAYVKPGDGNFDFGVAINTEKIWEIVEGVENSK